MVSIYNDDKAKCSGCGACKQACPVNCIHMQRDDEGFEYPTVEPDSCIECGKCKNVCPMINDIGNMSQFDHPRAVGGYHKDEEVREDSSSGGAFTLFAEYIIRNGGIVYGCSLDSSMKAVHIGVDDMDGLGKLRGSKYVQSSIGNIYKEVRENVLNGRLVLFVGTPCECAGLVTYLDNRVYANLYLCDFICHGVPSPMVFEKYIDSLETDNGSVKDFRFRNKDKGWNQSGLQQGTRIEFESGNTIRNHPAYRDNFMNGFLSDIYLRPSCYECHFKELPKNYADITIADFWGVDKCAPKLNDGKGTSLILLNTEHGNKLFETVRDKFEFEEVELKDALRKNKTIYKSAVENRCRNAFYKCLSEEGYDKASRRFLSTLSWAVNKVGRILWGVIERIVKAVLGPIMCKIDSSWDEAKWEGLFQFIKFAMVGVTNSVISYSINLLTLLCLRNANLEYDYIIANIVAFLLSVLWSFALNSRFVFEEKKGEERSKWKALVKTYASYAFSCIILNNLLGTLWIKVFGISKYIAPLMNLVITVPTNFVLNKFWAYRTAKKDKC